MASTNKRWISLKETIQHIQDSSLLDKFAAADLVESGLTSGRLKTRARRIKSIVGDADVRHPSREAVATTDPKELRRDFWQAGSRFSANLFEELESGTTVTTVMPQPPDFAIDDLEIHKADLRRWLLTEGSASISPSLRGKPPKEQAWAFLITLLIEETRDSGLTQEKFPRPESLLDLLHDEWDEREDNPNGHRSTEDPSVLHNRTITSVIEDVWETVVRGFR